MKNFKPNLNCVFFRTFRNQGVPRSRDNRTRGPMQGSYSWTYSLTSLSEKTRKSNHFQMLEQGSTFSSIILRPWVVVRPGIEPETSRTADWRLTNWANQAAVKLCNKRFSEIVNNSKHKLHKLLPTRNECKINLRAKRGFNVSFEYFRI